MIAFAWVGEMFVTGYTKERALVLRADTVVSESNSLNPKILYSTSKIDGSQERAGYKRKEM
jgi:hypothetical protein